VDWSNYLDEYSSPGRVNFESENRDTPRFDAFISKKESLSDHLLWQFLMTFPSPDEERVGSQIIGNLNRDGYLDIALEEIAGNCGCKAEDVEAVLTVLQTFDPVGVCSRNLGECLLIQAKHLGLEDDLLNEIVTNHLNHLENKNYKAICKALKVRFDDVVAVVNIIKGLEPRPGRKFSEEEPQYITPDIHVYKSEGDFIIVLNDDGMPKLRSTGSTKKPFPGGNLFPKTPRSTFRKNCALQPG
jgi:RNA polymerase sigma-54 factor